jgi:S1/P1 Nuclease
MRCARILAAAVLSTMLVSDARSFGPHGHETIGAIADELLKGKRAGEEIRSLLDGLSIAEAALLPDRIKEWDRRPPTRKDTFHIPDHPKIEKQLRAFWEANPPTRNNAYAEPSHHWFHYTDVPVGAKKYSQGQTGRSRWDVVHMIPFCIAVVRGDVNAENERKITRPVAIILLAHLVGDIHQPLHVGAAYFDADGKLVNPDAGNPGFPDEGGNRLLLDLQDPTARGAASTKNVNLHSYWDNDTVDTALDLVREEIRRENPGQRGSIRRSRLVRYLATHEPSKWRPVPRTDVRACAESWVDEILPIAGNAHRRLQFANISMEYDDGRAVARGMALPKSMADHMTYEQWSGRVIKDQIHKAGWRLAALFEQIIQSEESTSRR